MQERYIQNEEGSCEIHTRTLSLSLPTIQDNRRIHSPFCIHSPYVRLQMEEELRLPIHIQSDKVGAAHSSLASQRCSSRNYFERKNQPPSLRIMSRFIWQKVRGKKQKITKKDDFSCSSQTERRMDLVPIRSSSSCCCYVPVVRHT